MTRLSGRLNKEGVEGQSDRRDLISLVQASVSHCLHCRHTTDPQSLPSMLVSEIERDEREKGCKRREWCWAGTQEYNKSQKVINILNISLTYKTTFARVKTRRKNERKNIKQTRLWRKKRDGERSTKKETKQEENPAAAERRFHWWDLERWCNLERMVAVACTERGLLAPGWPSRGHTHLFADTGKHRVIKMNELMCGAPHKLGQIAMK